VVGGIAALAGVQTRTIRGRRGVLDPVKIRGAVRTRDIYFPRTSLICLENTHNRAGGAVVCIDEMEAIARVAKDLRIPIHLDGARIFNAAVALGVGVKELTKDADTVMFSLSKGLGAPVGSMLVGPREWIGRARKWRKMLGGGMRQAGIIAAAGIVALKEMVDRLEEDHRLARKLGQGLAQIKGINLNLDNEQTNIVVFDIEETGLSVSVFLTRLKEHGILAVAFGEHLVRMVTHKDVDESDMDKTLVAVREIVEK